MRQVHISTMTDLAATPLDAWMKERELRDQWLVDNLGVTQPHAGRIRRGKSRPSLEAAVQIEKLTEGAVRPSDFVAANDAEPAQAAA